MSKAVIAIISGGMDSITMLYDLIDKKNSVKALSFDYRQKHKKELNMAKWNCKRLGVSHEVVRLGKIMKGSCLTEDKINVPYGNYTDETMQLTVVPNRNMIMLSIAISRAISSGYDTVAYAAHSGDHAIYPDCRPKFVFSLRRLAKIVDYCPIDIYAPYLNKNKTEIIKRGLELGVDYSKTWTCYEGKEKPCLKCGSCRERLEAFQNNKIQDPLL